MKGAAGGLAWIALLALALLEVGAHARMRAGVASADDWQQAAAFVRAELAPRDLITAAPGWADPKLRQVLGDRIDAAMAGRSDTAAYARLWVLSIRGARAPEARGQPQVTRRFGAVQVQRFGLSEPTVVHDLVEHVRGARVEQIDAGRARPCPWRSRRPGRRGGLGLGVVPPADRFQCPDKRGFVWVAPVVMEDLSLRPRRCVFQHPSGKEPVAVEFGDIPLGEQLVVYAGVYYEHERMRQGAPIDLRVSIDGEPSGHMIHRDGDGWKRMVVPTGGASRGAIRFEVSSQRPHKRIFCWSASTRTAPPRGQGAS